ncbi:hypothetical protein BD309DRAFT_991590 [Dichomitus squalens]|uniref:Uncharacterized protein n=1 Tax=Dichomitus squalens TaxID=114155 RepID=A0A4V2K400_9APHY|nr:hypothetical protein BD309DRAFT_991590 [Dichomitus squalens]TBU58208.1 hypothetical protein BD310DRAFT_927565 [Dichomitus squalens]
MLFTLCASHTNVGAPYALTVYPTMFKTRVNAAAAPASSSSPEGAMKQALLAVVQLWEDRLQKQGVVTTFFISIDSLLFSLTSGTRSTDLHAWSHRDLVINASLGGAIIFHVCASIVAYVASFILIKYQLNDAEKKEHQSFNSPTRSRSASTSRYVPQFTEKPQTDRERTRRKHSSHTHRPSASGGSTLRPSSPVEMIADFPMEVFTDLRGLVSIDRAYPFWFLCCCFGARTKPGDHERTRGDPEAMVDRVTDRLKGMVDVLSRAHTVCTGMATVGFLLAVLGILTYSWTAVPLVLGIFASACLGVCAVAMVIALW